MARALGVATLLGLLGTPAGAAANDGSQQFNAWLADIALAHKGEVRHTPAMGRGVWALEDVKEGELLLEVPKRFVVCVDTVAASPHAEVFIQFTRKTDTLARVAALAARTAP